MKTKYALTLIATLVISLAVSAAEADRAFVNASTFNFMQQNKNLALIKPNVLFKTEGTGHVSMYYIVSYKPLQDASCPKCAYFGNGQVLVDVEQPSESRWIVKKASNIHVSQGPATCPVNGKGSGTIKFDWILAPKHEIALNYSLTPKGRFMLAGLLASGAIGLAGGYIYRNGVKTSAKNITDAVSSSVKKVFGDTNAPIPSKL